MQGMRRQATTEYRKNESARIAADVEAYLSRGGEIKSYGPEVYKRERITKDMRKYPVSRKGY